MASVSNSFSYYPFGMMLPARKFTSENYRYGFNGKENDDDVKGAGNQQDYGMRIYDYRLGRFLSMDPMFKKFAFSSTYNAMDNNPILLVDHYGKEPTKHNSVGLSEYVTLIKQINNIDALARIYKADWDPTGKVYEKRYLYSDKWGWLDMRHFAAAAWRSDNLFFSEKGTLKEGEQTENDQFQRNDPSGFDYEDLTSNLIGVYFLVYLESNEAQENDFQTNLKNYLTELGFVDNPLTTAPNALNGTLPKTHDTSTGEKNYSYLPKYATERLDGDLDSKIISFLINYLGNNSFDRRNADSKEKSNVKK